MCKEIEEEKDFCYCCGEELLDEDVFEFDGNLYCESCLDEQTFIYSRCGERYRNNENFGDSHINLCENCFEYYYTSVIKQENWQKYAGKMAKKFMGKVP